MGVARASRRSHRGKGNSRRQQQRGENFLHHFSLLRKISSPRGGLQTYSILSQPIYERGLKRECVAGAGVTRCNPVSLRSTPLSFEAIDLAPETPFPAIAKARRFVCGNRAVTAQKNPANVAGRRSHLLEIDCR
jgi:hypothetical protein